MTQTINMYMEIFLESHTKIIFNNNVANDSEKYFLLIEVLMLTQTFAVTGNK